MLYFTNETARVERRCCSGHLLKMGNYLVISKNVAFLKPVPDCPICGSYGALDPGKRTLIGRVTHGGGVSVNLSVETPISSQCRKKHRYRLTTNQPGYPLITEVTDLNSHLLPVMLCRIGSGNPREFLLLNLIIKPLYLIACTEISA